MFIMVVTVGGRLGASRREAQGQQEAAAPAMDGFGFLTSEPTAGPIPGLMEGGMGGGAGAGGGGLDALGGGASRPAFVSAPAAPPTRRPSAAPVLADTAAADTAAADTADADTDAADTADADAADADTDAADTDTDTAAAGINGAGTGSTDPALPPVSYRPGDLAVRLDEGLKMSAGLTATVVARSGDRVRLYGGPSGGSNVDGDGDGDEEELLFSGRDFGNAPAVGSVLPSEEEGDGWTLLINFGRSSGRGGTGALTFDGRGRAVGYLGNLLEGTSGNGGGGLTPWMTYVSCGTAEEDSGGKGFFGEGPEMIGGLYEVDPTGRTPPAPASVMEGWGETGDALPSYTAFAVDGRRVSAPAFFVAAGGDGGSSFVRRYRPGAASMNEHRFSPAFRLLQDPAAGAGVTDYLVLDPSDEDDEGGGDAGTFSWVAEAGGGRESSEAHFEDVSGMEVHGGIMYLAAREERRLLVLDLDAGTYSSESTEVGDLGADPTTVRHVLGAHFGRRRARLLRGPAGPSAGISSRSLHPGHAHSYAETVPQDVPSLYVAEAGDKKEANMVAGRTDDGRYVAVLVGRNWEDKGDVMGIAFSPDLMHMYVAFDGEGEVFDVTREDGWSFADPTLSPVYLGEEGEDDDR